MENNRKLLNLIGLATKAGKTVSGEFSTEKAVKTGKAWLVIVSAEASENTKKQFANMCAYYKVPIYFSEERKSWATPWGRNFAPPWRCWTRAFRRRW